MPPAVPRPSGAAKGAHYPAGTRGDIQAVTAIGFAGAVAGPRHLTCRAEGFQTVVS